MSDISAFKVPQPAELESVIAAEPHQEVLVQKPHRQEFFRSHAEHFPAHVIQWNRDGHFYLVHPELQVDLQSELRLVTLIPYVNRDGKVGLWPLSTIPSTWRVSAKEVIAQAQYQWLRAIPNMEKGAYETLPAASELGEPQWPEKTVDELVAEAFSDRLIVSLEHEVVRALRGDTAHV